jgi:hypothetical protein
MSDVLETVRVSDGLLAPSRLWGRAEVLQRPSAVPAAPGVYAWYFTAVPPSVPLEGCHRVDGAVLLYVGISPKRPPVDGSPGSHQTLRNRIRNHYRGNAAGSTLRLTLGSLLAGPLGIGLRRVGSTGSRMTFSYGEAALSAWMAEHARVCWVIDPHPWLTEAHLIADLILPLNLDQNTHGSFHAQLKYARAEQRLQAHALPVLPH